MLKKYVDKHNEWEMKKEKSKLKNKCDQSGRSLEKIKEDDQMKAEEKIEQKQFVETIVKNLDSKGHMTENNFFIVYFNTITPPSGTQEGKHYPCEMGLVGYSIQNGLNRSLHKFLSPIQIPFGYRFAAMKKSKETHNIPPDPYDFNKYEEDYIQIFESIKKFMSNNKFEKATLIVYVMPNHEDVANSILKFICEKAGQSEKTFKICLLPQLLFELMKLAPGRKRGNGEKMPIDSVWTATTHLDKDSFKYLPELGCDFHEEPGFNSHYCALTNARSLAFNMAEICSKAFNVRMQPGRHTPPENLGRSCAPSRVSTEIVKKAVTQETKNSWGTKISIHAAPAGVSPIPTGFDPNQVRLGPEAELFPGLHPELVENRSQVEDFSQRSIGHRDSFFQSGNSHRRTLLNSASVASVVKAGESNLIEQVSRKVGMLQLPSSNDSNNQTRHQVENGMTALDGIRPIQEREKVKENRKVMKEGIQACKFGGQKPAEGKEKSSLRFEIQIIKQEKGLNTDILVRKDLKDNGSHNIDMDNKTKHVERQRTSNGERLESSRARLSKDENVGNLIVEKNSAETGGRDVTNSVLERCSRGLNDSVYSTGGKNAFEVRGNVKSAIESRSVVTVPDNLNSTVGKSAFENGGKDVKLAVESRSISTVPNVLNSIVGKCEKVGRHRGRGSVMSNTANITVEKSSPTSTASVQNCNANSLKSRICMRRIVDITSSPGPSKASSPGSFIASSPGPSKASSPGPFIASSPGPSEAPPNFNIVTRSKSVENNANSSSGNSYRIACSFGNDLSGPEVVAKQLEDMFPHFSPEYLIEKAKKYVTIENAVDELLNEAAFEEDSKVKDDEMKCMSRVAKSLLLLGEEDMFKKVTLTEKRDFNPEDPLENKFRLAKGHYLSVSGQFSSPIESIDYVENRTLMENFERKKSEFRTEGKDTKEYLMFHGTNDVNVDSILKENFRMDLAGKHGQAHGRGIYFSEKTIIPNQYMNGAKKTLLLCRVLLGREFLGLDKDIPKGFDSKSVGRDHEKRANINIIKEVDQILPCFVLNLASSSGPGPNLFQYHQIPFHQFNLFPSGFVGGGIQINRKKPKNGNPTKK